MRVGEAKKYRPLASACSRESWDRTDPLMLRRRGASLSGEASPPPVEFAPLPTYSMIATSDVHWSLSRVHKKDLNSAVMSLAFGRQKDAEEESATLGAT